MPPTASSALAENGLAPTRPLWRDPAFGVAVGLFLLAGLVSLASARGGVHIAVLVRDPAAHFGFPPYAGLISHVGIALLTATAACAVMAAFLGAPHRRALFAAGALSAVLAVDDLFLLHETAPRLIEAGIFGLYGAMALLIALLLRSERAGTPLTGLKVAVAFLGISVVADVFKVYGPFAYWLEDFSKLAGFGAWAAFWIGLAAQGLRPAA